MVLYIFVFVFRPAGRKTIYKELRDPPLAYVLIQKLNHRHSSVVGRRSSVVGCGTRISSRQRARNECRTSASGDWSATPPSAVRMAPVTNEASSDARNSAHLAISSGRP